MTAEEIVYDVFEIKALLEDDHDIDQLWVLTKFNNYRSIYIAQDYALNNEIRPIWLQRLHKQKTTKVTSADDPSISITSITLSKVTLPELISLTEDTGLYRLSGSSGISHFDLMDFNTMIMKIDIGEERMGEYGYASRIGNDLYLYPLTMEIQAFVIAENPFDIQINDNGTLRTMRVTDPYPVDNAMAQKIILDILTKDLALNDKAINDTVNDSQQQFKILKSADPQYAEGSKGN